MSIGAVVTLVAALAWIGAGINKTGTGLVEPLVAIVGVALLAVGTVRRVMWVRGSGSRFIRRARPSSSAIPGERSRASISRRARALRRPVQPHATSLS